MKSARWIVTAELTQNLKQSLILVSISLLLGLMTSIAFKANEKIQSLFVMDKWIADVVVLPKAVSIADFKNDLSKGHARAFLPEAMFDSTVGLAEGGFKLTALMPVGGASSPSVLIKGPRDLVHSSLIEPNVAIEAWREQQQFSTAEWKNKLIFGFLASGTPENMQKLKDLVDRRTVGQAFLIKDQLAQDADRKNQMEAGLLIYGLVLLVLISFTFFSTYAWIKIRIANTFLVLDEIGFSKTIKAHITGTLFTILIVMPFLIGLFLALGVKI